MTRETTCETGAFLESNHSLKEVKMENQNSNGQLVPDRVSFSAGRKVSDGAYGSYDVHMSYSTDCKEGEEPQQAMDRAQAFVEGNIANQVERIKKAITKRGA